MLTMQKFFNCVLTISLLNQGTAFPQPSQVKRNELKNLLKLHSVPTALDTLTSGFASIVRVGENGLAGVNVAPNAKAQGDMKLKLFDVENCKNCRLVRELVTELDLVVDIVPVGVGSKNQVPKDAEAPCLVALLPNGEEGTTVTGVEAVTQLLKKTFTEKSNDLSTDSETLQQVIEAVTPLSLASAGILRAGRGSTVSPASIKRPRQKLALYSYEGNQFCRLVREVLTELDIDYELRSAGKGSPRRAELAELTGGSTQCPYLVDPNTDTSMAESADIIRHLYSKYARWTPPSEILQWASGSIMSAANPIFKFTAPLQAGSSGKDDSKYEGELDTARAEIKEETTSASVVVYTFSLSPFSFEAKQLLESLKIEYREISLGKSWLPGLVAPNGAIKRVALLDMTGQSSLPHIFIGGTPIGGLFSGKPGLVPLLEQDKLLAMVDETKVFE